MTRPNPRTPSPALIRTGRRTATLTAVLLTGAVLPAGASAGVTGLLQDCAADGTLNRIYSTAEYEQALKAMPTDMDEYTDCRNVIRRAQLGLGGASRADRHDAPGGGASENGGSGPGADGPADTGSGVRAYDDALTAATPQERAAVTRAAETAPVAVELAGQRVSPTALSRGGLDATNRLPAPLVAVLALLGAGLLMSAGRAARRALR